MDLSWYGPEPRRYSEPIETIEAFTPLAIAAAWKRADDALAHGYSIAGYVAYEADARDARALDGPVEEPLLALGIYRGSQPLEAESEDESEAALGPLVATISRERYEDDLAAIARALRAGDVYQVNYTVPFQFSYTGSARALAAALRARARVPYAAFVRHGERAIVSLSPERFFTIDGERIVTQPMKGTSLPEATHLLGEAKNRAEHVMIVDLLRNDLHRICDTVDVTGLLAIERFPTFATMTSTVVGQVRPDHGLREIFASLFPCGSITGAPKRSARAAIAHLEGAPRGIAMGAIGYCDAPRRGMWNVAIRTALLDERTRTGELRIGGGIVADSNARDEWAEIAIKRRAFDALATRVGLIETIVLAVDGSSPRMEAHFERLERSAFALGLPYDAERARHVFEDARRARATFPILIRIALSCDGAISATTRPLEPAPTKTCVCIVDASLDANDPTLRHKTSARTHYDVASRCATAAGCFDALLLNARGELADGARTTLFLEDSDGRFATPPLASGALAGILRAELLSSERAYEAVLRPSDLARRPVWLGNAARGLIRAYVRTPVPHA